MTRPLVVICCAVLIFFVSKVNSEIFRCNESVKLSNISCTISNYNIDNFTNFVLDSHYSSTYITALKFTHSTFGFIPSQLFKYFPNLTSLDLSDCDVREIRPNTFAFAGNLKNLTLSHNRLSSLYDSQFNGANKLVYIDLSYNEIKTIEGQPFVKLSKITKINLSNNQIKTLPNDIFFIMNLNLNFNELESINLNNINGSVIQADNNLLESDTVYAGNTRNLIELSLKNNSLTNLEFIRNMTNLLSLDLSYNRLKYGSETNSNVFENLNLKVLILRSTNLNAKLLTHLPNSLEKLDISANNLTTVDFNSLSLLKNLKKLHINENHLSNQSFIEFEYSFYNLKQIDISRNQWQCNNLKKVLTLLRQSNIEVIIHPMDLTRNELNIQGIYCLESSSGQNMTTQAVVIDSENRDNCYNSISDSPVLIITIIILLIIIIIIIIMNLCGTFYLYNRNIRSNELFSRQQADKESPAPTSPAPTSPAPTSPKVPVYKKGPSENGSEDVAFLMNPRPHQT